MNLPRLFPRSKPAPRALREWSKDSRKADAASDQERHWTAAETNRLNRSHWQKADGRSINADLTLNLEILRNRCEFEVKNNPILDGVITTHEDDLVGAYGPVLRVMSTSQEFNTRLAAAYEEWSESPTLQGRMSMAALLRLWVRGFWTAGEILCQMVTADGVTGPVKMRLNPLHPRRLQTPPSRAGEPNIGLGVATDGFGRPVAYMIAKEVPFGDFAWLSSEFDTVPAADMIHAFRQTEPDQVRGVPLATPCLPVTADLRDYDHAVLRAARQAADWEVFLHAQSNVGAIEEFTGTMEFVQGQVAALPPGYTPAMVQPHQPSDQYVSFRHERLGEIGRPVNMPLMMVRLTSQEHNFSSARFDDEVYDRGLKVFRCGMLEQQILDRIVTALATELQLSGALPERPRKVWWEWTWPRRPRVDADKEAKAEETELRTGLLTYRRALANRGDDFDRWLAEQREQKQIFEAEDFPNIAFTSKTGTPLAEETPEPAAPQRASSIPVIRVNGGAPHG